MRDPVAEILPRYPGGPVARDDTVDVVRDERDGSAGHQQLVDHLGDSITLGPRNDCPKVTRRAGGRASRPRSSARAWVHSIRETPVRAPWPRAQGRSPVATGGLRAIPNGRCRGQGRAVAHRRRAEGRPGSGAAAASTPTARCRRRTGAAPGEWTTSAPSHHDDTGTRQGDRAAATVVPAQRAERRQRRGSTGSLSSASTPNTHSCTR
jgi:hypothetical protein